MRTFAQAIILAIAALALSGTAPVPNGIKLQTTIHDGISLDFARNVFYVKPPGQAARFDRFENLFTFTRPSVGTFLGSNGLIQYANENQYQFSEDISNAFWTKNAATVTTNTTASPIGATTADTLTADAGTGTLPRYADLAALTMSGVKATVSVYAKAGTYNFVQFYINNQAADYANFNVNTCVVGTLGGAGTSQAFPVGGGWCRISFTYTPGSTDRRPFILMSASASATRAQTWNPAGTETVVFWGSQFQWGSLGEYLAATGAAKKYDQPRIEYDTNGNLLGWLIEPSITNLLLRSEDFTTTWVNTNTTDAADTAVAPDGNTTADTVTATAANGDISQDMAAAINGARSFAVYVRRSVGSGAVTAEMGKFTTACTVTTAWNRCSVTDTGTAATYAVVANVVTVTMTAHNMATNDAVRLDYTSGTAADFDCADITVTGANTFTCAQTTADTSGNVTVYANFGRVRIATNTDAVFLWGANGVRFAAPTSYIPTVDATITRQADQAVRTFGSEYSTVRGSIYINMDIISVNGGNNYVFGRGAGTDAAHYFYGALGAARMIDGTTAVTTANTSPLNTRSKVASAFDANGMAIVLDAGTVATGAFDGGWGSGTTISFQLNEVHMHILTFDYWPERKSDQFLRLKTFPGKTSSLVPANDNLRRAHG